MSTVAEQLHFDSSEDGTETDVYREALRGNFAPLQKRSLTFSITRHDDKAQSSKEMEKELQQRFAKIRETLVQD